MNRAPRSVPPTSTSLASAAARSTSAACAAPASAARRLSSSAASRASNSRRCATVSRSSAVLFLFQAAIERALPPGGDRARRAPLPPGAARASSCSRFCASRVCFVGRVLQLRSWPTIAFSCLWCSALSARDGVRRLRDRAPRAPRFPRRAAPARSRSAAIRSRSSLISRLVSRMPRASARPPPETRCGPRNTSPSSVAIGSGVSRLAAAARRVRRAIQASPIACADGGGERAVDAQTTDDSATTPSGATRLHVAIDRAWYARTRPVAPLRRR